MKKIFAAGVIALSFTACNTPSSENKTMAADTTMAPMTTETQPVVTTAYVPAEGDVVYKDSKVMVWHNNAYVVSDKDVELENGLVVSPNGEIVRDDEYVQLEDGETVSKTGNFFNKTGDAISDGWAGAKKGVRKAGEGIKKGAEKAGEGIKKGAQKTGEAIKSVVD